LNGVRFLVKTVLRIWREKSFHSQKKIAKKLNILVGKFFLRKKDCAFEWCLVLSQKYTKSFGGKNLALRDGF